MWYECVALVATGDVTSFFYGCMGLFNETLAVLSNEPVFQMFLAVLLLCGVWYGTLAFLRSAKGLAN